MKTWQQLGPYLALIVLIVVVAIRLIVPLPEEYKEHHPETDIGNKVMYGAERSSQWPKIRAAYLKGNPVCEACGCATDINVHHVIPFHESPELELDPCNLITLCRKHHGDLGHVCEDGRMNWKCSNPNIRNDAVRFLFKSQGIE